MKRLVWPVVPTLIVLLLSGCGGTVLTPPDASPHVRSVAVASLVLELEPSAAGLLPSSQSELRQDAADTLLQISEATLAQTWQVVPAMTFAASDGYRLLTTPSDAAVLLPRSGEAELGVFADGAALRKARIDAALATELCAVSGADAVLVIHSAWSVRTGNGGPAARAHSSNTVSMWDRGGRQLFVRRVDKAGELTVGGAASRGSLDPHQVVGDFLRSYSQALELILK